MPVFHFTIHAYRSWTPDNPRGYVKPGQGILPRDSLMARHYERAARESAIRFGPLEQQLIFRSIKETCQRHDWRFHGTGSDPTHVHTVMSWRGAERSTFVLARLKNGASYVLSKEIGPLGRRWLARGGSRKQVRDRDHLNDLLESYFPNHRGVFWCEGMASGK